MDTDAPPPATTATPAAAPEPATAADPPADADDAHPPTRRESKRLRERSAPVLVALPAHPRPDREPTPPDARRAPAPLFASKHYPASAHGDGRRSQHTHFPRLPPDHAPGPLPDGASASFSYRGPPQPPVPGAAPPVPPPPGGTPLVLDRERPAEFAAPSQQAVLANMLSQRIDQVDQLRTELAHAEARIASLSARSNPSAALRQAEARAEAAEARLAAIKDGWRGVESYLDMLARREAEARAAFVRTLGTGEVGVPPSVPVFGAAPTSPYMPVRPPVPPNVPRAGPTFPALPPAPVVGGNPVIWRHESGHPRRRPADTDDAEPPHKRARPDRRGRDREREREVRKEKARFSDSPSPAPVQKDDADLSPPIAALNDDKDADADADADEEVDQIVDDVEMAAPNANRPRRASDTAATTAPVARAGSSGARSDGAVKDLKKDGTNGTATDAGTTQSTTAAPTSTAPTQADDALDAEGSPETDTDELSVDEELLKLSSKKRPRHDYPEYDRHEYDRAGEYPRGEYARGHPEDYGRGRDEYERAHYARYAGPNGPGGNGDPRYHGGWYPDDGFYGREGDYREPPHARPYPPPAPRGDSFTQRNGSGSGTAAPWYAHLKQGAAIATNTQGQRTCRQCGLAGRYKDGKCVEKWGPGPEGPGTVCDRCRKKMKRVERRGTADASMLASGLGPLPLHQHSFHSAPQTQTQSQSQSQMSQTQLGTQYSPTRWNGNGRYENGAPNGNGNGNGARYEDGQGGRGEKRYDLLPSHYGPPPSSGPEDEGAAQAQGGGRRGGAKGGRRREREASAEPKEAAAPAPAAPANPPAAVEA